MRVHEKPPRKSQLFLFISFSFSNSTNSVVLNQVLESDLRKKMAHVQEVYNQAKHTLTYFSFQKQRLEDLMSQMTERLEAVEGSLSDLTEATSLEDIGTVKVCISPDQSQKLLFTV